MADVQPLRALHYDPAVAGPLEDVVAPPYDVIDAAQRAALIARSPFNVVGVDLPAGRARPRMRPRRELFESWQLQGALVRDSEPALWAHAQDYTGPDGQRRTRRGFFCRVRIEGYGPGRVRPHERTHPGPKEDRLRLTRATRANISPIFSLFDDPANAAWSALEPFTAGEPWGEVTDADDTVHRLWRVADAPGNRRGAGGDARRRAADRRRPPPLRDDGSLRRRDRRRRRAPLHAHVPGRAAGPRPDRVPDAPAGQPPRRRPSAPRSRRRSSATSRSSEVAQSEVAPAPGEGPLQLGYVTSQDERAYRLTLKDQAIADRALSGHSDAYRHLDTGVLETLLLKGALGLSDDDISHFNGLFYARDTAEALAKVRSGEYDAAFLMRPTPIAQVRDVAAEGENMPPKSTYFFPKLLTGLLFNPLS